MRDRAAKRGVRQRINSSTELVEQLKRPACALVRTRLILIAALALYSQSGSAQTIDCANSTAVGNGGSNLEADCETLLGLKDQLRGTGTLNWSTDVDMASWTGVRVKSGVVSWLDLSRSGLTGTLPSALADLTSPDYLYLDANSLTGSIPDSIGNMTTLQALWLHNNNLSGDVPESLANLTLSSNYFSIHDNRLTGCVPPAVAAKFAKDFFYQQGMVVLEVCGFRLSVAPARISEPQTDTSETLAVTAAWKTARVFQNSTSINLTTTAGTAKTPDDFSSDGATVTIPSNASQGTGNLVIEVKHDETAEPDETLTVVAILDGVFSGWTAGRATHTVRITGNDRAPVFNQSNLISSIDENRSGRLGLAPIEATDPDGDAVTLSVDGTDEFTIDSSSRLSAVRAFDYEALSQAERTKSFNVVATSADGSAQLPVQVRINDVNEKPGKPSAPDVSGASSTSLSVSWSAPSNTGPAVNDYDLQYREGTSGDWTDLGQSGTETSATITGLKASTSYEVQVRALSPEGTGAWSDSGSGTTDENQAPVIQGDNPATRTVAETEPVGANVGAAFTATDVEGDPLTWTISGSDRYSVDAGQIKVSNPLNYELESSHSVTVTVSDGKLSDTVAVNITVEDVEEAPNAPGAPSVSGASKTSLSVTWDAPLNLGPAINDYDVQYRKGTTGDWVEHAHGDTNRSTTITALEVGTSYQVQVRASSEEGTGGWSQPPGSGSTNANQAPVIQGNDPASRSVNENSTHGTEVGFAFTATDANAEDSLTWSLSGTDAGLFSISGGQITVSGALDHEASPTRSVTVEVSDGTAKDTVDVAVTVNDLTEVPGKPNAPSVSGASKTSLSVTWDSPSNMGPAINDYDVQYREGTTGNWTTHAHSGIGRATTIPGLEENTGYQVQVMAKSPEGGSSWSDSGMGSTNENQAPVITNKTPSGRQVDENSPSGTNLEGGDAFSATDANAEDTLTWSLSGTDAGLFSISGGQITVSGALDHEASATRSVTVRVSDGKASDSVDVIVAVVDQTEPPDRPGAPSVAGASKTSLGVTWSAPSNMGPAINDYDVQYREGTTGDWIDHAHSGDGTSTTIPNLREVTSYQVQVMAKSPEGESGWSDSGMGSTSENQAPVITNKTPSGRQVDENSASGTNLEGGDAFRGNDPDGDLLTWTLSGTHADLFSIESGQIKVSGALDFEAGESRSVTVHVGDGAASDSVDVIVTVIDVDEAPGRPEPPDVSGASKTSLSVTWRAPSNRGPPIDDYDIQFRPGTSGGWTAHPHNGDGTSTTIPGLAADTSYQVQVRAKSPEGAGEWSPSGTGVTDPNQAPVITNKTPSGRSVAENSPSGENVGAAFTATDADGDTLIWTLSGTNAGLFSISGGQIMVSGALNHEAGETRSVTVRVSDGSDSDTVDVTVAVIDEEEPPGTPDAPSVSAASKTSLAVNWSAPGNTGPPVEDYDVQFRRGMSGSWSDHTHDGLESSTTIGDLVEETLYEVRVKAKSPEGESDWSGPGAGSTRENRAPVIVGGDQASRKVAENSESGIHVGEAFTANDPDGDSLTWSLSGADAGLFSIDAGQIRVAGSLDHEATPTGSVTVQVSDGAVSDSVDVTISVTDVDEPPWIPDAPNVSAASKTSLTVSWSAPANTGPPINDYDLRYREGASGAWTDREHSGSDAWATISGLIENTSYQVQVRAENPEGVSDWSEIGTGSTDDNRSPVIDGDASASRSVAEDSDAGNNLGEAFTASDADGDPLTWTLSGADAALFSIEAGQVKVAGSLDHEADDTLNIIVRVSDGSVSSSVDVTVNVTDVDEPPDAPDAPRVSGASSSSLSVTWSAPSNTGPAIDDYDLRYRQGTSEAWNESEHTGTVASAVIEGLNEDSSYQVQVRASNDEGTGDWSASGTGATIANSAPVIDGDDPASRSVMENSAIGTAVGEAFTATDADGDALTWTIEGADAELFTINAGQLAVSGMLDHEGDDSLELTVRVSDGLESDRVAVTVTVTDIDEPVLTLNLTPQSIAENGGESQITASLARASSADTRITVSVAPIAPAIGADFRVSTSRTLSIPAGETTSTGGVTVTAVDNVEVSANKTLRISAEAVNDAGITGPEDVLLTLVDDDAYGVTVNPSSLRLEEGSSADYSLVLNAKPHGTVSISVTYAPQELTATPATLQFSESDWSVAKTVTVSAVDNALIEDERSVSISHSALGGGYDSVAVPSLTVTMVDNDFGSAQEQALIGALAGLGRTFASDAVDAIGGRLELGASPGCGEPSRRQSTSLPNIVFSALGGAQVTPGQLGPADVTSGDLAAFYGLGSEPGVSGRQRGRDVPTLWPLLPNRFEFQLAGARDNRDNTEVCAPSMGLWGQVTESRLSAETEGYEVVGRLRSGFFGLDQQFSENLTLGVGVSHSLGDLDARSPTWVGAYDGLSDASMTSVLPYGRLNFPHGHVWALLSGGVGSIDIQDARGTQEADVKMGMAALGVRRDWNDVRLGGMQLAVKGDAFSTWLESEELPESVPEVSAESQRVRAILEGSLDLSDRQDASTQLRLQAGGRWDGGDASGGAGMEVGLSVTHRNPQSGLDIEAGSRVTLVHQAEQFEDRSLNLAVSWDPGVRGEGLRFSLAPTWGGAQRGGFASMTSMTHGVFEPGRTIPRGPSLRDWHPSQFETTLGYGWSEEHSRIRDMYATMRSGEFSGSELLVGGRMDMLDPLGLMMSLELMRRRQPDGETDLGVQLRFSQRLGHPTTLAKNTNRSDELNRRQSFASVFNLDRDHLRLDSYAQPSLAPAPNVGESLREPIKIPKLGPAYWIAIGSFQNIEAARQLARHAEKVTGRAFAVRANEGAGLSRVAIGPHLGAADAKRALDELFSHGLDGWIYQDAALASAPEKSLAMERQAASASDRASASVSSAIQTEKTKANGVAGHWVSIGSFREHSRARQLAWRAEAATGRAFVVRINEMSDIKRVVNGPHSDAPRAQKALDEMRTEGFDGWIYQDVADAVFGTQVEAGHWVSIGTFSDRDVAQQLARRAESSTGRAFEVRPYGTAGLNRVVNGPFESAEGARQALLELRERGFACWTYER